MPSLSGRRCLTFAAVAISLATLAPFPEPATSAEAPVEPSASGPRHGAVLSPLNWVDDIIHALGYFKANYPGVDFVPYLKQLSMVREAVSREDARTVRVEMLAFFESLAERRYGITGYAADELAGFARIAMPVHEYGSVFPRSGERRAYDGSRRAGRGIDPLRPDPPASLYP
jgi:hypothetical protein